MDWCIKPYVEANHPPRAALNGASEPVIAIRDAAPGEAIALDASGSRDPDGRPLAFRWSCYPEAGTYAGDVKIPDADAAETAIRIPDDAAGAEIHVILDVRNLCPEAPLSDYRRLVLNVS